MQIISHVVAAALNNGIGKNGQLLWHLPNDLKFFKNTTWGMPVIMGRKTFESVSKPLPGRINIVVTRQPGWKAEGVIVVSSLERALEEASKTNCKEWFIIGGGELYLQSIHLVNKIYLTVVKTDAAADTFYPSFDRSGWNLIDEQHFSADDRHAFDYSFQIWVKK